MIDHDAEQRREHSWQPIVEKAIREADEIITEASDGTEKMTDALTTELAISLFRVTAIRGHGLTSLEASTAVIRAVSRVFQIIHIECQEADDIVRNYLQMKVAQAFVKKVAIRFSSALMKWESENPAQS